MIIRTKVSENAGNKVKISDIHLQMREDARNSGLDAILRAFFNSCGFIKKVESLEDDTATPIFSNAPVISVSSSILSIESGDLLVENANGIWSVLTILDSLSSKKYISSIIKKQLAQYDLSVLPSNGVYSIFIEHSENYKYPFRATFTPASNEVTFENGVLDKVFEPNMHIMYSGSYYKIQSVNVGANKLVLTAAHGRTDSNVFIEIGGNFATPLPTSANDFRFVAMDGLTFSYTAGSVASSGVKVKIGEVTKTGSTYVFASTGQDTAAQAYPADVGTLLTGFVGFMDHNLGGHKITNLGNGVSGGDAVNKSQLDLKGSKNAEGGWTGSHTFTNAAVQFVNPQDGSPVIQIIDDADDSVLLEIDDNGQIFVKNITVNPGGDPGTITHFKETTFTPTWVGATTPGTTTYTKQVGRFQRINGMCRVYIAVEFSAMTGVGDVVVGTLPEAARSDVTYGFMRIPITYLNGSNWLLGFIEINGLTFKVFAIGGVPLQCSDFTSGGIICMFEYPMP